MAKCMAAFLGILAGLFCLFYLQRWVDDARRGEDPAAQVQDMKKDQINGFGLEGDQALSQTRLAEFDGIVLYEDRLIRRFSYEQQRLTAFGEMIKNLRSACPDVEELYVLPVPERTLVEAEFEEDRQRYAQFLEQLAACLGESAGIVDPLPKLSEHTEEYIFFRTEYGWTARGAYYAAASLCGKMGVTPIPLGDYEEYMYNTFQGAFNSQMRKAYAEEKELEKVARFPDDACFYYCFPESKNIETVVKGGTASVEPILSRSRLGRSTFIGGSYAWAVLSGDAQSEKLREETILMICDDSGKLLAPFLANYCDSLYAVNLAWDTSFPERLPEILEKYNIQRIVVAQTAMSMGDASYSAALRLGVK